MNLILWLIEGVGLSLVVQVLASLERRRNGGK